MWNITIYDFLQNYESYLQVMEEIQTAESELCFFQFYFLVM